MGKLFLGVILAVTWLKMQTIIAMMDVDSSWMFRFL
jgi:hypothetical protein